jgi:large subunit ribosomal protein L2
MPIKKYRPLTPALRYKTGLTFEEITKKHPEKALTKGKPSNAGRGAGGRISVRRKD